MVEQTPVMQEVESDLTGVNVVRKSSIEDLNKPMKIEVVLVEITTFESRRFSYQI